MKRGRTAAETCALNGWTVGTVLRGHERWGSGDGVWTTIRVTAIGEESILARCVSHTRTYADGSEDYAHDCRDGEHMWTLADREWTTTPDPQQAVGATSAAVAAEGEAAT